MRLFLIISLLFICLASSGVINSHAAGPSTNWTQKKRAIFQKKTLHTKISTTEQQESLEREFTQHHLFKVTANTVLFFVLIGVLFCFVSIEPEHYVLTFQSCCASLFKILYPKHFFR